MTEEEIVILNNARTLINRYQQIINQDAVSLEEEKDDLYREYWNLIHNNIDKDIIKETQNKIGYDQFITDIFLNTLEELLENRDRVVDEYQGFTLIYCKDCWGGMSYFVYENNFQYSEALYFVSDKTAISYIRNAIDDNPGNPDFYY